MRVKDFICRNCKHNDFKFRANPSNRNIIGIYCSYCGRWFKWADKDEKNLMRLAESEDKAE